MTVSAKWAETIGINTYKVVNSILTSGRVEQQSYRACMGLLKLAERKSSQQLESACAKALQYSNSPSYKSIKNILAADHGAKSEAPQKQTNENSQSASPVVPVITEVRDHDKPEYD